MKITRWFRGAAAAPRAETLAASPQALRPRDARRLPKALASLRAVFVGGRSKEARPPVGDATRTAGAARQLQRVPVEDVRAKTSPSPRTRRPLSVTPAQTALAAKWATRIKVAASAEPYVSDLARSGLAADAANAVTALSIALARDKARDDVARGEQPAVIDNLGATRYLAWARSAVMREYRESAAREGDAAADAMLQRRLAERQCGETVATGHA